MRIKNSLTNISFGLFSQVISILINFGMRTVFIQKLGIEYLGLEGLFTGILMALSLANLGFDTAIIYSLYKPLADKDKVKIQALMNLYRKAYKVVGLVILSIGLLLAPFLKYFIDGEPAVENITLIYILFLLNTAISYLFVYKQSILIADQKTYIISKVHIYFVIVTNVIQILILLTTKNYILILITQIIFRVLENIYIVRLTNKLYPYINVKNNSKLTSEDKKEFYQNLYSLFLYKISGVIINGTDNIIISKFIGLTFVGLYSNYLLIISTISNLISYIFHSLNASVGNLNVTGTVEKKYLIFRVVNFLSFWIFGVTSVCLWIGLNPLIIIWLGERYILSDFVVFSVLLNFFTMGMQNASTMFRETTGLFRKGKYRPLIAAFLNLFFSVLLVKYIGLPGVFIGTVLSRICTYFWYDPYIIYRNVFNKSVFSYFSRYILNTLIIVIVLYILNYVSSIIYLANKYVDLCVDLTISFFITNLILILVYRNTEEYVYLANVFSDFIKRFKTASVSSNQVMKG